MHPGVEIVPTLPPLGSVQRAALLAAASVGAFGGVVRVAARALGLPYAAVILPDRRLVRVVGWVGLRRGDPQPPFRLRASSCRALFQGSATISVPERSAVDDPALQELMQTGGIESLLAIPLPPTPSGVAGVLCVADTRPRRWSGEDLGLLGELAEVVNGGVARAVEAQFAKGELLVRTAYLEQLFDSSPEGVVMLDREDRVVRSNPEFSRMFGYGVDEVVGHPINDLIVPPAGLAEAEDASRRAMAGAKVEQELVRRRKDGSAIHVSLLTSPVRSGGEQIGVYAIYRDVTRRWEVEATLEQNEQRFRSLIENAADTVLILAAGGTIEYASPSIERMLGHRAEALVGSNAFTLVHPDDAPEVIARFTRLTRAQDCGASTECRVRNGSGGWRTLDIRASNLLGDAAVRGIVLNARDVTEERQAEQTRQRLNAFLEATPDFVATFDPHGRALSVNAAFRRLARLAPDADLSALTIPDFFPQRATERILNEGIPTAVREGVWVGETWLGGGEAAEVPVSQMILAHKAANGTVEFLSTLARDITDRKQAEVRLRQSEQQFRSMIENALDVITVLDADGVIAFGSPAVERVLGYDPAELVGTSIHALLDPDDGARARRNLKHADQARMRHPAEFRIRHKDGSWRVLESVANNLLDDPAVGGIVVNSRDVTERRAAEDALRDSQEQLLQSQKMEAVGRLAGGVAHDFNNLLTAIKGFTELLLLDFDDRDPRRPFVTEIQSAANRAASLTRQLLAFSRKQVLQPRVLELSAVVGEMEKMLQRLLGEDVDLVTRLAARPTPTRADPGQMEQVLLNLAVNARDAMPDGGRITVETAVVELEAGSLARQADVTPGSYVRLSVGDTGCGMDELTQQRIFEPFFTTKEQGKGTGLGLSTVYGIVKQSGGYIDLQSAPGAGATFHVYLPVVEEEVEKKVEAAPALDLEGPETVLLVEDEVAVRVLVRRVLDRKGYRVLEAESGAHALTLVSAHAGDIDLLLTDVVMPGMSGRDLAVQLGPRFPDMRILYMSGYTDDAIVHHGVLDPDVQFLEKPFTPDLLLRKLREVLDAPLRPAP